MRQTKVRAALTACYGKTKDLDDVGRIGKERKFRALDDNEAKFMALAMLKQAARRWRTSDRLTFTELMCWDKCPGGKPRVYHCRSILCEKQTILRMALSYKNAEEAWVLGGTKS